MLDGFLFCCNFVSADSCGICEQKGGKAGGGGRFALPGALPPGAARGAVGGLVAEGAGKAPAADRLLQAAASDALSPKANSPSGSLRRLTFNTTQLPSSRPEVPHVRHSVFVD